MKRYVCGFVFSSDFRTVVLIQKRRPDWQVGLLNGVGGGIEPGEEPVEAMSRECREECGIEIVPLNRWTHFLDWTGPHVQVHFFFATGPALAARSLTDELIGLYEVSDLQALRTVPNLQWLIPLCIQYSRPHADGYRIAAPIQVVEEPQA
jgi:8-oxo-dGTP pyrophosphatase MutT (NUDIX family)